VLEHFHLAGGEVRSRGEFGQSGRDVGRNEPLSGGRRADGGDELVDHRVLDQVRARPRAQRAMNVGVAVIGRESDHSGLGVDAADRADRRHAVDLRHLEVHEHDVGTLGLEERDRFRTVARQAHDIDVGLVGEHRRDAGANHRMVVGRENANASAVSLHHSLRVLVWEYCSGRGGENIARMPDL
jgi:hypothetical protein